jgi:ATP/maltotriose-dependent transcriptional regulator MalT
MSSETHELLQTEGLTELPAARAGIQPPAASWALRRLIVRTRIAFASMRLEEVSDTITQLEHLLGGCAASDYIRYEPVLRVLRASSLAAEGRFEVARSVLGTLRQLQDDSVVVSLRRYVDWRCAVQDAQIPDTVDYLVPAVGGRICYRIVGLCVSAAIAFDRLHLAVAADLAAQALELVKLRRGADSPLTLLPATLLAGVAYEQGRLDEAEALLVPRLPAIRAGALPECLTRASVVLARLAFHRGRRRAALDILHDAQVLGHDRGWLQVVSVVSAEYARLLRLMHREEEAGWPVAVRPWRALEPSSERLEALLTDVFTRCPPPDGRHRFAEIETALADAGTLVASRSVEEGYRLLVRCLRLGYAHGLRMIFVDAGPEVLEMLTAVYDASAQMDAHVCEARPYVASVLKSSMLASSQGTGPRQVRLSPREVSVLQMISHGLSNKSIARALGITPETVKTHAKSIFAKLAARTRAQAVARAEAMGLL